MNLSDIRVNIDCVDKEMRRLFIERMSLSEQVVTVKSETGDKIFKPDREKDIISRNSQGVDHAIEHEYQSMIKRIMEVSRKYQYGRMLELRNCFPFDYEQEAAKITRVALLSEQEEMASLFSFCDYQKAEDYESMADMILEDQVDAGIAVMEEVGFGVNDAFHKMLSQHHFYINDCIVTSDTQPKKCVVFSKKLYVLPDHNRFKIMFSCPNNAGSCAAILSMISDYRVNFTEMHSTPVRVLSDVESGMTWDYRFFLELEGNMGEKDMHSLIFQLSEETNHFQLLGSYHCEGDFA